MQPVAIRSSSMNFAPLRVLGFRSPARAIASLVALWALAAAIPLSLTAAVKWADVAPADLAATTSLTAPDADSEIIFSRHTLDSNHRSTWLKSHIQAKIYTEKGVELASLFTIDHEKKYKISNIAARVIKPDGTFVELSKNDFRETTLAKKRGGFIIERTAFVFPGLQPGDLIEYRWEQDIPDDYFNTLQLYCQAEVPTREYVLSLADTRTDSNVEFFNCPTAERVPKKKEVVIRNLPAWVAEPAMPAESEYRGWILVLFSHPFMRYYKEAGSAWDLLGKHLGESFIFDTAPNKNIRAKAAELVAGATTPEEKIARLHRFAQSSIKNFHWTDHADVIDEKRKRDREEHDQTAAKTLERGTGYPIDINRLFAGLARAAGFEVRLALNADRDWVRDIHKPRGWVFANRETIAIKIGDRWTFHNPGSYLVPTGLLGAKDASVVAHVCDEDKPWFAMIPPSLPAQTESRRTGQFTLDEEGTLTGDVVVHLTGHRALEARTEWWSSSERSILDEIRDSLIKRFPTAEVSDLTLEHRFDNTQPFTLRYHVNIPAFATAIGSRLAFTPNFFEANSTERFTAETRRYPVLLDYAEQQRDEIEIVLPPDYALDGASAPHPVASAEDVIHARYHLKYTPKNRTLVYARDYRVGLPTDGSLQFPASSYPALRRLLSDLHRSDTHQLMIKRRAPVAALSSVPHRASAP